MNIKWNLKDLIDLEYFFYKDSETDESLNDLDARDRQIYLEHIEPDFAKEDLLIEQKKVVIKKWLDFRKVYEKQDKKSTKVFPGDIFDEANKILVLLFMFFGILAGVGLCSAFLVYKGTEPLNISVYLGVFVVLQVIIVLILCGFTFFRKKNLQLNSGFLSLLVIENFLNTIVQKLVRKGFGKLSAQHRNSILAFLGGLKYKTKIYKAPLYWSFFMVAQIFGIFFNIGVLIATLLKVIGSDLAFGWQSTLQLSSDAVYSIVKFLSLPWSWFMPLNIAYPSIEQINGSRMVLKDGIYHLATNDLVAWWPFLCLCVLFYGFLPRIFIFLFSLFAKKKAILQIDFDTIECDNLIHRLKTPILSTQGYKPYEYTGKDNYLDNIDIMGEKINSDTTVIPNGYVLAFIPEDIINECDKHEIDKIIQDVLKLRLWEMIAIDLNIEEEEKLLESFKQIQWENNSIYILMLYEAWQPPIREIMSFVLKVRKIFGQKARIYIGLIGKPAQDTIFTCPNDKDFQVWNQEIKKIGDPLIYVERLKFKDET